MTTQTIILIDETPPPSEAETKKFNDRLKSWTKVNPNLSLLLRTQGEDSDPNETT